MLIEIPRSRRVLRDDLRALIIDKDQAFSLVDVPKGKIEKQLGRKISEAEWGQFQEEVFNVIGYGDVGDGAGPLTEEDILLEVVSIVPVDDDEEDNPDDDWGGDWDDFGGEGQEDADVGAPDDPRE